MTDRIVDSAASVRLGIVEGDLTVGRNARIAAESGKKVIVTGAARFEAPVTVECDFECQSLDVQGRGYGPGGDVTFLGDLSVRGRADVDASVSAQKVTAEDLDVAGHLESGPLTSKRIRVGGHLTAKGDIKADTVDVGGHMKIQGIIESKDLRVGGHAEFEGGTITGEIKVRGHFKPSKKLDFGKIEVFGSLTLPAGSTGQKLSAQGKVEFQGNATCKELEVNGVARVRGDCSSESVEVKGKLDVRGDLEVASRLRVYGSADAEGAIECGELGVLGKTKAQSITARTRAEIAGEVDTKAGLKAESVLVGRGSNVAGPLIGNEVEIGGDADFGNMWGLPWWRSAIGRATRVDDVHGKTVRIGPFSRAERIFGDFVELREGARAYQVTYTKELKLSSRYHLHDPPVKVEKLPEPPL